MGWPTRQQLTVGVQLARILVDHLALTLLQASYMMIIGPILNHVCGFLVISLLPLAKGT